MDGEGDSASSVQLEAMGFTSFGQQHKRPKHHHKGALESAQGPARPQTDPAQPIQYLKEIPRSGDNGKTDFLEQGRQHQPHSFINQEILEGNRPTRRNLTEDESGGSPDAYYSRSFVENPWRRLEMRMGIIVGKTKGCAEEG